MEDDALTPEQYTEQQENYERLYQSIARLTALQRELVRLRYRNGLRFAEIAAVLEKPEGTVRQLFVRTVRQFRPIYAQLERGEQRANRLMTCPPNITTPTLKNLKPSPHSPN